MKKKTPIALLIIFIVIQFFRPEKNESNDQTFSIDKKYPMNENIDYMLKSACYDCHSNNTTYPWYFNVQPVAWLLAYDVKEGKSKLNYSNFINLPIAVQNHKFDEMIELVEEKKMPIKIYTAFGLHKEAKLTDSQRSELTAWFKDQMKMLQETYPPDSLILKRKTEKED